MDTSRRRLIIPLLLATAVLLIVVGGAYFYSQKHSTVATQATSTGEDLPSMVVGPLTVTPLTPILYKDQPSTFSTDSVIFVPTDNLYAAVPQQMIDAIQKLDTELKRKDSYDFSIMYMDDAKSVVVYMMTPTGTGCTPPGNMLAGCDKAVLKIFDVKQNTIHVLTHDFGDGQGGLLVNKKDNTLIVLMGSHYQIFDLVAPYALVDATPSGGFSALENEYLLSYTAADLHLVIKNILTQQTISCTVTNPEAVSRLKRQAGISISPDGHKLVLHTGDNTFFWSDITGDWSSSKPDCLSFGKVVQLPGIQIDSRFFEAGTWYSHSSYFGNSDYGSDASLYSFQAQKQVLAMPWKDAKGIGVIVNRGYADKLNFGKIQMSIVPGEKKISIYFHMPDGGQYLVGTYADEGSTQAFYNRLQQYPFGSADSFTSGYLIDDNLPHGGAPELWALVLRDDGSPSILHVLLLSGYTIHQVLDVSVNGTIPRLSVDPKTIAIGDMVGPWRTDYILQLSFGTTGMPTKGSIHFTGDLVVSGHLSADSKTDSLLFTPTTGDLLNLPAVEGATPEQFFALTGDVSELASQVGKDLSVVIKNFAITFDGGQGPVSSAEFVHVAY